jgi:TonB family protein
MLQDWLMVARNWLAEWSAWLWPLFVNHLWQSTLFAALAFAAIHLLKRSPARARYTVLWIISVKFILPSAFLILLVSQAGFEFPHLFPSYQEKASVIAQVNEPVGEFYVEEVVVENSSVNSLNLLTVLTIVWFAGSVLLLSLWIRKRNQFAKAMKAGIEVSQGREAESLRNVQSWLFVKREVRLIISPKISEPGVWGILRPIIVLPEMMADHLTDPELDAVIMHEMIHIARWDNLASNVQMLLCCLFWFHPLVWFLDKKLLNEREMACDEKVVELGGAHGIYAASLLKVLKFCLGLRVAGVSAAGGSNLKRRIDKIMSNEAPSKMALSHRILLIAVASAVIIFSLAAGLITRDRIATAQNRTRSSNVPVEGVQGGIPGGVVGGVPGGVPGGIPGGVVGGIPGGIPDGVEGEVNPPDMQKLSEELDKAPETVIHFKNSSNSPISITEAKMKAVKNYANLKKQGDTFVEQGTVYAVRFDIQMVNNTARAIKGIALSVKAPEKGGYMFFERTEPLIQPNGLYTYVSYHRFSNLGGEPEALVAKVVGVIFEDGEVWGKVPPPPPPPPPPPGETPPYAPASPNQGVPPPPPPPEAAPAPPYTSDHPAIIRKSGGVMAGSAVKRVDASYPPVAQAAKVSGTVVVEITVDEEGNVINARALSGHSLLKDAAVTAARQWVFQPTTLQGQPVKVVGTLTFNFQAD